MLRLGSQRRNSYAHCRAGSERQQLDDHHCERCCGGATRFQLYIYEHCTSETVLRTKAGKVGEDFRNKARKRGCGEQYTCVKNEEQGTFNVHPCIDLNHVSNTFTIPLNSHYIPTSSTHPQPSSTHLPTHPPIHSQPTTECKSCCFTMRSELLLIFTNASVPSVPIFTNVSFLEFVPFYLQGTARTVV
jgi:hypothetical protein